MTIRMKDGMMFGALSDPDAACEHIVNMLKTKGAILEYVEPMAQVLAAAGRASEEAMGDSADYAVRAWSNVILERALDILREERADDRKKEEAKFAALTDQKHARRESDS
jgi:hypothetical protein